MVGVLRLIANQSFIGSTPIGAFPLPNGLKPTAPTRIIAESARSQRPRKDALAVTPNDVREVAFE